MSWISPRAVPRTTLPKSHARSRVQHFRFKNLHGSLHRFGRSQQIGQKHLAAPELIAGEGDAAANPWFTASSGSTTAVERLLRQFRGLIWRAVDDALAHCSKSGSDTEPPFEVSRRIRPIRRGLYVSDSHKNVICGTSRFSAYPTCTVSIDMDPPSTPSIGKVTTSPCWRLPSTYSMGR